MTKRKIISKQGAAVKHVAEMANKILMSNIYSAGQRAAPVQSILEEAVQTVGQANRGSDYGHPLDNFEMEAKFMNIWLDYRNRNELDPSAKIHGHLTAKDMAIHKIFMKIAREANRHKRDNSVDIAGYAWCLEEMLQEEERRYK